MYLIISLDLVLNNLPKNLELDGFSLETCVDSLRCVKNYHVLQGGRDSIFQPCTSKLEVFDDYGLSESFQTRKDRFAPTVEQFKHDKKIGLSC